MHEAQLQQKSCPFTATWYQTGCLRMAFSQSPCKSHTVSKGMVSWGPNWNTSARDILKYIYRFLLVCPNPGVSLWAVGWNEDQTQSAAQMKALTFTYFQKKTSNPTRPFSEECFWSKSLVLFPWCALLSSCLNFPCWFVSPPEESLSLYTQMTWLGRQCLPWKQKYYNSYFKCNSCYFGVNWSCSI